MSAGHLPRHEELLPAYALGALEGDELRELESHMASGCGECARQVALWQGDLEELAASVEPITPSETTRRRIQRLAGTGGTAVQGRSRSSFPWAMLVAAAALLIAVGLGLRQARLSEEMDRVASERDRLARQVSGMSQQAGLARAEAQRMAVSLGIMTSPETRCVHLAGVGPTPTAVGHAFVNTRRGKAVFFALGLPELESGKTYQLWWIEGGKPVSAGIFKVDERGTGNIQVERAPKGATDAWAVTVESAGGVPQPTGDMVLKG